MATAVIDIYDGTTADASSLPPGEQAAGYTTGTGIAWSPEQFAAHNTPFPAVRIDQDTGASDPTADLLDVETNAANVGEIVRWITQARASFNTAKRPGQRWPGIYIGLGNLDAAVADLKAAGITDVPFGIPDLTNRADAVTKVSTATGPYWRAWQQYLFGQNFDSGIVSVPWLTKVSGAVVTTVSVPNVVGSTAGAAHNALVAAGLVPTAAAGQKATDIVTSTEPAAGVSVAVGSKVVIVTTLPEITLVIQGAELAPINGKSFTVTL